MNCVTKFILSISLLLFMLVPEVAVSAIMGSTPSETTGSNNKIQWLEEETETETISSLTERVFQKIGGTAGGGAIEQKPFTTLHLAAFRSSNSPNACGWIFISKYPRYIQFCCLKLDCSFILS
jgi:hypothetical protein